MVYTVLLSLLLLMPLPTLAQTVLCDPTRTDSSSVTIAWTPPVLDERGYWTHKGYVLEREEGMPVKAPAARGVGSVSLQEQLAGQGTTTTMVLPPTATSYLDKGLAAGTYGYRLLAIHVRPNGSEVPSPYARWGTPNPCVVVVGPPPAPGNLTVNPQ